MQCDIAGGCMRIYSHNFKDSDGNSPDIFILINT